MFDNMTADMFDDMIADMEANEKSKLAYPIF